MSLMSSRRLCKPDLTNATMSSKHQVQFKNDNKSISQEKNSSSGSTGKFTNMSAGAHYAN